jgi:hypothetical protein
LVTLLTAYSLRNPCRFCFAPAALLGFALRSFLLTRGIRPFPPGRTHLPFLSSVYPHTRGAGAGSTSRGSWVLTLVRVPGSQHVFSRPAAGCSPGFSPFRATRESLGQDFARPPLTRFLVRIYTLPPAPQSLHQLPLDLILPARRTGWGRVRHPLRVPAPSQS